MSKEVNRVLAAYTDIVIGEDFNCRKNLGNIDELAESIKLHGLLQPLVVREGGPAKTDGKRKLFLVAGERRYRALGKLGVKQVEVKLVKGNSQEISLLNFIENDQREDLDPLEAAQAMQKYMETYKVNQTELAKRLGKSSPYVSQRLALLKKATPELQDALEKGEVTSTHAREIVTLPPEEQREMVEEIRKEEKETGKKPGAAKVKDAADIRKSKNKPAKTRKSSGSDYDLDKIRATKEAYEGQDMTVMSKKGILEVLGLLLERLERSKTPDSRAIIKGQIVVIERILGVRDSL